MKNRTLIASSTLAFLLFGCIRTVTPPPAGLDRIVAWEMANQTGWSVVSHLADEIGPRFAGSENGAEAIRWAAEELRSWGLEVRVDPVMVPHWVRGEERAWLPSHRNQKIVVTALGPSVATPAGGIRAEVMKVSSLEELDARADEARGKIILFYGVFDRDKALAGKSFEAYSEVVSLRSRGPSRAAAHGAVATVVRSVGGASLRTPHTGGFRYDDEAPKIPAGAVTTEDADLIHRLIERGERVVMHLILETRTLAPVESGNVIAEIPGETRPDEIVLIGGHLDSWDLGTGAIDNGAGVAGTMAAIKAIVETGLRPARTIRLVLFTNEEMGLSGARDYFARYGERDRHYATLESDSGATSPIGFATTLTREELALLDGLFDPLESLGIRTFTTSPAVGADTSPLSRAGVVGFGLRSDSRLYFDYHHTPADTLDKIDRRELTENAAAVAAMTWILANAEQESLKGEPEE